MEKSRGTTYTYGYYSGMNPNRARFTLANRGVAAPKFETACELGFGQGLTLAINSAASNCSWYGTDIEPAHVTFARGLTSHYKTKCNLYDQSFQDLLNNSELNQFDYICLHGIWTWVNNSDRKIICEFIDKKLKPGGLLYVSYNTLPGWSNFLPIRKLMASYCENNNTIESDELKNLTDSFQFAQTLMDTNPAFLKANPSVGTRLKKIEGQDKNYLVHEYLAADFTPMTFDEMARWLTPLNLNYVCSSEMLEDLDLINLTKKQQKFLSGIKNSVFRETCRDLMVNKEFRRDYWIKGAQALPKHDQETELNKFSLLLTSNVDDVKSELDGVLGKAKKEEAIYRPLLDYLRNHEERSYREIIDAMAKSEIDEGRAAQAVQVLFAEGHLNVISPERDDENIKKAVRGLNKKIMDKAGGDLKISSLASPVIEGGVPANKFNQLFLRGGKLGCSTAEEYAESAWSILKTYDQKIIKDKVVLKSDKENLNYLKEEAGNYLTKVVPIFKSLDLLD